MYKAGCRGCVLVRNHAEFIANFGYDLTDPYPEKYPCLVGHLAGVWCFTYEEEARRLISAINGASESKTKGPTQDDFNRQTAATLYALTDAVVGPLVTEKEFMRKLTQGVACVDQWSAEDREILSAKPAEDREILSAKPAEKMLNRFLPE